ncbi:MAG: hypothetical protein EXR99_10135 [Gemmataceae bacterium]|nr:hypothetical protein [Gemmataceae bacterium]
MYRSINSEAVVITCGLLQSRIQERFPQSGLNQICKELVTVASEASAHISEIQKPHWLIRAGVALALSLGFVTAILLFLSFHGNFGVNDVTDFLQGLEAAINLAIFLGLAIYFLITLERRLKRKSAFESLHELRSIAHVIDMHQLTKDPGGIAGQLPATASSPERKLSRQELARYLDYCSEMLSLVSKVAAMYAQGLNDVEILSTVDDIESLTNGLASKIWQKILVVNQPAPPATSPG